jgi:RNA 2',3'-cyclic 3'-phosphodiesterase
VSAAPLTERLFYALWPSEAERARTAQAAARLALGAPARGVLAEDYHVTLAFVGGVAPARLDRLRAVGAASGGRPGALCFDAYEFWPKPEVVVAAARAIPPALERLWRDVHARLAAAGFALAPKPLRPHVTLLRAVRAPPAWPPFEPFAWEARELCLVRSERGGARTAYTVVDRWPLLDEPPGG